MSLQQCHLLQALACACLGHWYQEVGNDLQKAKNCYEETLLIDPQAEEVAASLKQVNEKLGLNVYATENAHLSLLSMEKPPSVFAAHSQKSFDSLSPKGMPSGFLGAIHVLVLSQRCPHLLMNGI